MSFADNLRLLMEERKTSNYRLAKEVGCSNSTVANWLGGKEPGADTLRKIANYFSVSVDYLLGNVSEPYFHLDNERILREINSYEDGSWQKEKPTTENSDELTRDESELFTLLRAASPAKRAAILALLRAE